LFNKIFNKELNKYMLKYNFEILLSQINYKNDFQIISHLKND